MEENKRERWKKAVLPEEDTKMGFYLNSRAPYVLYEGETKSRYFIDKTLMLEKIFGFIEEEVDGLYEKYLVDTVLHELVGSLVLETQVCVIFHWPKGSGRIS